MGFKSLIAVTVVALAVSFSNTSHAQSIVSEDFTQNVTQQSWFFFQGACLTAGKATDTAALNPPNPGIIPGCVNVYTTYYGLPDSTTNKVADANMTGGQRGYLGSSTAPSGTAPAVSIVPDDVGSGALRFTNGSPGGYFERGAIVSSTTFPTGQGVQITFKTMTYLGNSGGSGKDGADGISFFLMDGCTPISGGTVPSGCGTNPIYGTGVTFAAIGATGGSLAYSCSNGNTPYDGLVGAYLGVGIDEYGNFLNGTTNTLSETNSSSTGGDDTNSGGLYQPGRIGMRGAGSVAWQALTNAYGTASSNGPYYPASLTTCSNSGIYNASNNTCSASCTIGVYNSSANNCSVCASGYTFNSTTNLCTTCSTGTYNATTNSCSTPYTCPSGSTYSSSTSSCSPTCNTGALNPSTNACNVCPSNSTFDPTNTSNGATAGKPCGSCSTGAYVVGGLCGGSSSITWKAPKSTSTANLPTSTLVTASPTTASASGVVYYKQAVQKTCSSGHLWNYTNPASPTDAGPATLPTDPTNPNSLNTAGILDYAAIPGAYSVIPTPTASPTAGFLIAAEGARTRSAASPILYNLKITQDGLLSFSYSYNGGATVPVITGQQITTSNGPLPASFRFGFAGSTGGSNNVHEILCFKAAPVQNSTTSGDVNVYQNPTIKTGTQTFLANYFPSDWTGQLEAIGITTDASGNPIAAAVNWDARCVLSGIDPGTGVCDSTGQASPSAQGATNRVMLTWDPVSNKAEAFEWSSGITAAQKTTLNAGDSTSTANRLNYLRGDRTNEITSSGSGLYRARDAVLSDIVDSSPTWIGPPQDPYTLVASWVDQLNPLVSQPENASGAQSYADYMSASATGALNRANVVYAGANDGFLHGFRAGALDSQGNLVTTTYPNDGREVLAYMPAAVLNAIHPVDSTGKVIATIDFSNTQYAHNWYVDSTPGQGDVFYGNQWHTWVVSGLGPGGGAIFALDVTNPANFSEANASSIVLGEWNATSITCPKQSTTACGANLGNTFGTPQIRRFHSGQWGFVFGNGYGSSTGASGIYIALLDKTTGAPTFYYYPTSLKAHASSGNGIGPTAPADLDLDHTIDYVYAGDLLGNVWRFDVTNTDPTQWHVSSSSPMFNAGAPITTQIQVSAVKTLTTVTNAVGLNLSNSSQRVTLDFGTGQQIPQTLTNATLYATGQQYMIGIWDWDMGTPTTAGTWNALSSGQQGIGLTGSQSITFSNMTQQTLTETFSQTSSSGTATTGTATLTHNPVCWNGSTTCSSGNTSMGWYIKLPSTSEQIIFDPYITTSDGSLIFNTFIPAANSPLSCDQATTQGFTIGMAADTGAGLTLPLFSVGGTSYDGVQNNAVGTGSVLNAGAAGNGKNYLLTHDSSGKLTFTQMNSYNVTTGQRIYWIQKR
jgi:type IV pilus assembly protein PilY1